MIRYDEIFCSNIAGGAWDGALAVTIELGDNLGCELSALTTSILRFGKARLLRIKGSDKASTPEDLRSLIMTLRENGYGIISVTFGDSRPPWLEMATYRIVVINEQPWLSYAANEIHYNPEIKIDIKPPLLQQIHLQSILYIDSHRDLTPRELFDFISRFPAFRIWSPPTKLYRMPLEIKEEG